MICLETVKGRNFSSEAAQRRNLDFLFLGNLFQRVVVLLERFLFGAQFIEARNLGQHPGVGTRHTGYGEHTDHRTSNKNIEIMQRYGNLKQLSVSITSNKNQVIPFSHVSSPRVRNHSSQGSLASAVGKT